MKRCFRAPPATLPALFLLSISLATPPAAAADPRAAKSAPTTHLLAQAAAQQTPEQLKAQQHYNRSKELYEAGSYREAIAELEAARKLDPKGSRLVLNLAIVHEKLGKYDEALGYLKSYLEMDLTAADRAKGETMVKRIEGAKREAPVTPPPTPTTSNGKKEPPPAPPPPEPQSGRMDGLTIGLGVVAAVGLAAGAGLGIYALTSRPDEFVTGRDGSFATLQEETDASHTMAIAADVSLGVGAVAGIGALWAYFGRTKDPGTTGQRTVAPGRGVSLAPSPTGAAVVWSGAF